MPISHRARSIALTVLAVNCFGGLAVHADIVGFTPGSYQYMQGDTGSAPVVGPDSIQLTSGRGQRRSLFFNTPQDITKFSARFTYRANEFVRSPNTQGLAFVIQNDSEGDGALGDPLTSVSGPYGLGYAGIAPSLAVTIELTSEPYLTYSGTYTGGVLACIFHDSSFAGVRA